mmetsp:Transcript_2629/g.6060  ORF Transcript_2629/g.6060 Transcript_2629/m.6060 type:complete len:208 (-) Transcript_2629:2273-2896(-)
MRMFQRHHRRPMLVNQQARRRRRRRKRRGGKQKKKKQWRNREGLLQGRRKGPKRITAQTLPLMTPTNRETSKTTQPLPRPFWNNTMNTLRVVVLSRLTLLIIARCRPVPVKTTLSISSSSSGRKGLIPQMLLLPRHRRRLHPRRPFQSLHHLRPLLRFWRSRRQATPNHSVHLGLGLTVLLPLLLPLPTLILRIVFRLGRWRRSVRG